MSQITTHILDTSQGKPAYNVKVTLHELHNNEWLQISEGITNKDGRIPELLPSGKIVSPGFYKFVFHISEYFKSQNIKSFYPQVTIEFEIIDSSHYHVPLLLNPFGYSTYRGS
ncbi:MAG: hydroxyisourate hydrolase [Bacteroidetes bacterium]|nr:hydroxyisourate hydrolase [Bacteroidota bacterium]